MDTMCRTCLRSPQTLLPLFDDVQLCNKIETISSVKISKTSYLPTNICAECVININLAYNFRRVVINSDRELKHRANVLFVQCEIGNNSTDKDEMLFDQIEIKSEGLTEEQLVDVGDDHVVSEDVPDEILEAKFVVEDSDQLGIETDIKVLEVVEANGPKNRLSKTVLYKLQPPFKENAKFNNHKRSSKVSKSVCNICGKTIRSDNIKKHISIHTELPVKCKICGKTCKNSESLRAHVLIHKGIEITCEFCGQIFKFRGGYKRHVQKKHTAGFHRKAKCHLCEKCFHDNNDLKKHLRSHTGERPYPCEYCKKGFSSSYALKTHIRQHTQEKPYKCDFCSMAFPQKVSLRTHLKSKHSVLLEKAS